MTLAELADHLAALAGGDLPLATLRAHLAHAQATEPLGARGSDAARWDADPAAERLLWRLVHLFDGEVPDDDATRALAGRIVRCLADTGSPATTFELLALVRDQPRLCTIVARHAAGVISRTGFLSVVAESGYPAHVKLWLEHADDAALERACARMATGEWRALARALERAPDAADRPE